MRWIEKQLRSAYGQPTHGNFEDPTDELFYALLSKKTPPERYRPIFQKFRERYSPWDKLLDVSLEELAVLFKPLGISEVRGEQTLRIAQKLHEDFGGVSLDNLIEQSVQDAHKYLLNLPGVGEKIARCVLMYSFGHDISPMDTHATRILVRFGLLPTGTDPRKAHTVVDKFMPPGLSKSFHVTSVAHGRAICFSRSPKCETCIIASRCKKQGV